LLDELMRKFRSFGHRFALGAVLVVAAPVAFAAPAKRHKPHAAAAPAAASAQEDAPPKPDDAPAKPEEKAPEPTTPAPPEVEPQATLESDVKPRLEPERALGNPEEEALGRREAARLAAGRTEVAVLASVDIGNRRFTYSDPVGAALLRPYKLPAAPMLSFGLEAYPWATSNVPVLRDLGFRGHISRAFAVDSHTPEGGKLDTSWTRFGGDIRERVLVPGPHALELGIDAGADASYFVLKSQTQVAALLPSARTISLRFGLDARLLVTGRFSVMLGAAYLLNTSRGEIYDRFRDPHVAGIDGDFGAALGILPGLEARLTGRYTRYFATFKPAVGDHTVAGGALDEQMQLGLGARYAH
jgi:hypothetical protein